MAQHIRVAEQWIDFKVFFALLSSFLDCQYTKSILGKLRQPWKFINFSATSALISYKLVSCKKRVFAKNGLPEITEISEDLFISNIQSKFLKADGK